MKTTLQRIAMAAVMASMGVGCTTAYDAYGRPRTVVDPGAAAVGVAAAGLVGYGIGRSHDRHRYYDYDRHHSHRHHARHRGHHHRYYW
jgi:hypothetical protein